MLFFTLFVSVFAGLASCHADGEPEYAKSPMPGEHRLNQQHPVISASVSVLTDALHLEYELENTLDFPIIVFDRLYDMDKRALDPEWYYADIEGRSLTVYRKVWPLPRGLHHENPEVPYGRRVAAGETASGAIQIDLPVREWNPYYGIGRRTDRETSVTLSHLSMEMGWASVENLAWAGVANLNDEELFLFDYNAATSIQQTVTTQEIPADVAGIVSK